MNKNWFRRLFFSYFPIFLFTVTILVFISFIMLNDISHKETIKADRTTTNYAADRITRSLKAIEMDMLSEVQKNNNYREFLEPEKANENSQIIFDVVASMRDIVASDTLIDSMYIYRIKDKQVLTRSGLVSWDSFADKAFIEQALANPEYGGWSDIRTYHELKLEPQQRIISMYKREPLPFGTDGIVIINVNMYAVEQMLRTMINDEVSVLNVRDGNGELLFSTISGSAEADGKPPKVLNRVEVDLLGWTFESGIVTEQLFMWLSLVSYIWVGIGVLTVLFASLYIIYITRKNYKPIRVMMNRVESVSLRSGTFGQKVDELAFIDHALENLIQKTEDYDKQRHENLLVNRRQLFHDIVHGEQLEKVKGRLWKLGLVPEGVTLSKMSFIVAEISQYGDFRSDFSSRDQHALKFALMNVMQELAQADGMYGLAEWVSENRIGIIVGFSDENAPAKDQITDFAQKGNGWVKDHLRMSLLFGIGPVVRSWTEIGQSYSAALEALQHKMSLGDRTVFASDEMPGPGSRSWYVYVQSGAELVREFRLADGSWRNCAEAMFWQMQRDCLRDTEIVMLLDTTLEMLAREMDGMSRELTAHFEGKEAVDWRAAVDAASTLEGLKSLFLDRLTEIYRTYVAYSETKNHRAMINEMRSYIEENFDNPDLSLKHLSDRFQVSAKYGSYLFKEEFNMKFVDFLVQLRMERAEQLLADTSETVQQIALRVGYANSITFGRVFKRLVGVTPGDFRKLQMKPGKARYNSII
ncbi:helix-turn-helix domain-containing protein [Paenibacillus sp. CAU 1782]